MTNTKAHEDSSCSVDPITSGITKSNDLKISDNGLEANPNDSQKLVENAIASSEKVVKNGFEGFGFSSELLETIEKKGYKEPSPIQKAAFPELMLGRDLVGQAQTGTGKLQPLRYPYSNN